MRHLTYNYLMINKILNKIQFRLTKVTLGYASIKYNSKGPITIRLTPLPSFLVNFSTFAFLLNFSFMK